MWVCSQYNLAASAASVSINKQISSGSNLPTLSYSGDGRSCSIDEAMEIFGSETVAIEVEYGKGSGCNCAREALCVVLDLGIWYGS